MDYYKRYMGDYGRDTSRLSMLEHGAYSLLLDDYYSARTPLPESLDELYRICRATTKAEQTAVASVAKRFFPVGADGLRHNNRADKEIVKWEQMAEENREHGKLGGRPKKNPSGSSGGNPNGNHPGSSGETRKETKRVISGFEKQSFSKPAENPLQNPIPESRIQNPEPTPLRARAREEGGDAKVAESGRVFDPDDAWREAHPNCDVQAYESWLAYRAEDGDPIPPRVRIEHAKFLATKGTAEEQRAFVSRLIQLQFKRLHEPSANGPAASANGQPQRKRWHPQDGDPFEPKEVPP